MPIKVNLRHPGVQCNLHENDFLSLDFHIRDESEINTRRNDEQFSDFTTLNFKNEEASLSVYIENHEQYQKILDSLYDSHYSTDIQLVTDKDISHIINILEDLNSTNNLKESDKELLERLIKRKQSL